MSIKMSAMQEAIHEKEKVRGLVLLSGGLDSQLAVCVLREQGVYVEGLAFDSPFFSIGSARDAATQLDIGLQVKDFTGDIVSLLSEPKHGFGKCMNPCVDCHALMLRRAGEAMEEQGFHFLATGEVLNERPKSQNRQALNIVAAESGYSDFVLRPLSARLLPETQPERAGLVDRDKLLALEGRARRVQFTLAEKYNLSNYPSPAGGCRLTEPNFCRRLEDLRDHEGLKGTKNLEMLKYGRHFRLADNVKAIVGRNEDDNAVIEGNAELYELTLKVEDAPGPTAVLPVTSREDHVIKIASICARYSDCPQDQPAKLRVRSAKGQRTIEVMPASMNEIDKLRI
jgi:PP-loop superfamily ATP-utilizing enzyme